MNNMNRREFLQTSGGMALGVAVVASGPLALMLPSPVLAQQLQVLKDTQGWILVQAIRHIFPHRTVPNTVYAKIVQELDAEAATDKATAKLLKQGIVGLHKAAKGKWMKLPAERQLKLLEKIADTPFFKKVQGTAVVSLYNNKATWKELGYPGSSFEQGGYINRGFDDLSWLPNPPEDASPKKAD